MRGEPGGSDGPDRWEGPRGLSVDMELRLGTLLLEVDFQVPPGGVVGLLGPNGAGKTSILHALAGLRRPSRGRVSLNGRVLVDVEEGIRVPAAGRHAGMAFQDDLLFPHLTVVENVAFGPRARGADRSEAETRARRWLERLHAEGLAERRPDRLSGGEAQRVALARALATEPECLLLDEPLSALDAQARLEVRRELKTVLEGFSGPAILVTHDPLEAVGLADRLLILERGRITQRGSVEEVTARPRSSWVARLLGLNFFRGVSSGRTVEVGGGLLLATGDGPTGDVCGVFEPSRVRVQAAEAIEPAGRPRWTADTPRPGGPGSWLAPLAGVESLGSRFRLHLRGPLPLVAEASLNSDELDRLSRQGAVRVSVPPDAVRIYPD